MTNGIDNIRHALTYAEDVDLPPGLAAGPADDSGYPDDDGASPPPPPGDGDGINWDAIRAASDLPLNDLGNGKRFALHFGRDARRVPRLGWYLWDETRWAVDPDDIRIRAKAHCLSDLIARECHFLRPEGKYEEAQARRETVADRLTDLDALPKPTPEERAEARTLKIELRKIDEMLGQVQDRIGRRLRHAKQA
ncbi:MAG: hypothetical protein ACRCYS_09290, partial [Beijerinckiaceae bacterium]